MDDFLIALPPLGKCLGIKPSDSHGKFGAFLITDADDFTLRKNAINAGDTFGQEAFFLFPEGRLGTPINDQGALGTMKKRDPALAALELAFRRQKTGCPHPLPGSWLERIPLLSGADEHGNAGADGNARRFDLGDHATGRRHAGGSLGHLSHFPD